MLSRSVFFVRRSTSLLLPTLFVWVCKQVAKGAKPKYSGMVDCAKQLHATGGLKSVFKGWEVTLMRDVPG